MSFIAPLPTASIKNVRFSNVLQEEEECRNNDTSSKSSLAVDGEVEEPVVLVKHGHEDVIVNSKGVFVGSLRPGTAVASAVSLLSVMSTEKLQKLIHTIKSNNYLKWLIFVFGLIMLAILCFRGYIISQVFDESHANVVFELLMCVLNVERETCGELQKVITLLLQNNSTYSATL
jgi:hypothetical protein